MWYIINKRTWLRDAIKGNNWSGNCSFDWNIQLPANWTHVSWTTCEDFKNLFFPSQWPSMSLRWTTYPFGIYEVGRVLATPLIEWRWTLWANPPWTLTNLSITETSFSQTNPTPWTWYGNNDSDVTIVLWNTKTYHWNLQDDQWRSATASWSYTGTYPYYWTSVNITTLTKQSLLPIWSSYFPVSMVAETGWDKYKADFETANITITWVQFYNTVSWAWERMWWSKTNSLALWTQNAVTHMVQGNTVNYTRYTHNGLDWGAIDVRFYTT